MGCAFGVALSLVVICGAELFTGNNMVMTAGMTCRTVSVPDALKLWLLCWVGNLLGGILLSIFFFLTDLDTGATLDAITSAAAAKMTARPVALFMRGVLCNILVCLAVWSGFRSQSDAGKLIMVFWCLLAFFATGFEHSIANMTVLTVALLDRAGNTSITLPGYCYNLALVTLGNMAGGILLVGCPYYIGSRQKEPT
jgi:nitrite transporter NirC